MELELIKVLASYGLLGVVTAIACVVAYRKDQQLQKERDDYLSRIEADRTAHRAQLEALSERYITKADTWMTKYHELSDNMRNLIDQIHKRG